MTYRLRRPEVFEPPARAGSCYKVAQSARNLTCKCPILSELTKLSAVAVAEILYWFSRTSKVFRQPSIKLLEASLKSGFAVSRFPGLQIACSDEVFLPDLHYWNVIFLNDSAEMAWRKARLKGRTRNIEEALARLALHYLWAHGILRAPKCASKVPSC